MPGFCPSRVGVRPNDDGDDFPSCRGLHRRRAAGCHRAAVRFRRESNGQLGKWDYILTLLLPGTYTITFTLSGFQEMQRVTPARTPVLPLEVSLGVAGVRDGVVCVGRAAEVLVQTAQVATNFRKSSWRR